MTECEWILAPPPAMRLRDRERNSIVSERAWVKRSRWWLALSCPLLLTGCATYHYNHTPPGHLTGKLFVEWYKPNLFKYIPDTDDPLTFVRSNSDAVKPKEMYTDGGSIPRAFWVFKNYSPWGYGPAFVAHDWLFHVKNCDLQGYPAYSLKDAANVMSEIMRTLLDTPGFDYGSKSSMYLMYLAVQTAPAKSAWEHGTCQEPSLIRPLGAPDARIELDFSSSAR